MTRTFKFQNQNGQVILFVVVAMVIALGLGIAVSARTLTSLSRVADSDTSARALAAAEGGAERMLRQNYESVIYPLISGNKCKTLPDLLANESAAISNGCLITFNYSPTLATRAYITVNDMDPVPDANFAQLTMADVKEVRLDPTLNATVRVCWTSLPGNPSTVMYAGYSKAGSGTIEVKTKGVITPINGNTGSLNLANTSGFAVQSTGSSEFQQCSNPIATNGATRFRIRPVGGQIEKGRISATGGNNLPSQGFVIVSYGQLQQGGKQIRRAVRVTKTFPYAAYSLFDYAIYSDQGDVKTN